VFNSDCSTFISLSGEHIDVVLLLLNKMGLKGKFLSFYRYRLFKHALYNYESVLVHLEFNSLCLRKSGLNAIFLTVYSAPRFRPSFLETVGFVCHFQTSAILRVTSVIRRSSLLLYSHSLINANSRRNYILREKSITLYNLRHQ
jgi:hypothetical protein